MKNTISLGLLLVSLVSSALAFAGPGLVLQGTKLNGQEAQGPSAGLTIAGVALVNGHLVTRR
ncbi:MAG: hypothetical protein ABJE95_24025 [Byssovorax sp.]